MSPAGEPFVVISHDAHDTHHTPLSSVVDLPPDGEPMSDAAQYLLVVYQLAGPSGEPVASGRVADELGRSPSSATEMLQRLADQGLVDYQPYEGTRLTDAGREQAAELQESYLVLRRFFEDVLDLDDPDAEAFELAGSVSPLVTDRLATTVFDIEPSDRRVTASTVDHGGTDPLDRLNRD